MLCVLWHRDAKTWSDFNLYGYYLGTVSKLGQNIRRVLAVAAAQLCLASIITIFIT